MSDRASIKNALVTAMNLEFNAANEGAKYYNDMDQNVLGDLLFLQDIETFPAITVALGPEHPEYQSSGFRWQHLTMYLRAYVKSEDESEEQLERIISDIKKFIDNFERLQYTVTNPDGTNTVKTLTQITVMSTTTDEGIFSPLALGEINIEVRYASHNTR